jgi:hypothetical protein
MKMVTEDGVSENLDPAEIGDLPELFAQNLLGWIVEDSFAVHRAGHAMVNCLTHLRLNLNARRSHWLFRNQFALHWGKTMSFGQLDFTLSLKTVSVP